MAHYDMDDFDLQEVEDTLGYKFARDLIRYVLQIRMAGLHWIPQGIFEINDLPEHPESPFTPRIRATVRAKLDLYENRYHMRFDNYFPDETVTRDLYKELCRRTRAQFLSREFSVDEFFRFFVLIAKYAGYAYLHVADSAEVAFKIMVATVRHLMRMRVIDDNIWNEMQDWAPNADLHEAAEPGDDEANGHEGPGSDDTEKTDTSSESGRQP